MAGLLIIVVQPKNLLLCLQPAYRTQTQTADSGINLFLHLGTCHIHPSRLHTFLIGEFVQGGLACFQPNCQLIQLVRMHANRLAFARAG